MQASEEVEVASFEELPGVSQWLVNSCRKMGLVKPTPVQAHCIPPMIEGRDIVASAETGSGKTAAFAIPILNKLARDPFGLFALVLTPTRELAVQISEQFLAIGAPISVRVSVIVGGQDLMHQAVELSRRPHIIVATPGRLEELLMNNNTLSLNCIQFVIFDEADRLLDPSSSFVKPLDTIMAKLPKRLQTGLFSATMTPFLQTAGGQVSSLPVTDPFMYQLGSTYQPVETCNQRFLFMPLLVKECYLVWLMRSNPRSCVMIFCATCRRAELIHQMLSMLKIRCTSLHSYLTQLQRTNALQRFRSLHCRVLVTTDVASRYGFLLVVKYHRQTGDLTSPLWT
eukprot:TRINITY_DN2642_c0_g1_i1.p1 TRINITY_DN2642_c0_g1~~TRINITY_DN2642_c0_g1_i1.p1  ORF type:complete len:341 (-),score=51.83 TRINITY_DN2642_c0_g1_i1:443-1465(-)